MTDTPTHSPTPWQVEKRPPTRPYIVAVTYDTRQSGSTITCGNPTNDVPVWRGGADIEELARRDAEHIVKCVNEHDALVSAGNATSYGRTPLTYALLKEMVEGYQYTDYSDETLAKISAELDALVAAAQGMTVGDTLRHTVSIAYNLHNKLGCYGLGIEERHELEAQLDSAMITLHEAANAAQGMTVEQARKVLPSGDGWYYEKVYSGNDHFRKKGTMQFIRYSCVHHCVDKWQTWPTMNREMRDAAERLFDAMQGDSPEAVALREEYS